MKIMTKDSSDPFHNSSKTSTNPFSNSSKSVGDWWNNSSKGSNQSSKKMGSALTWILIGLAILLVIGGLVWVISKSGGGAGGAGSGALGYGNLIIE